MCALGRACACPLVEKKKQPNVFHPHPSVAFSCGAGLPLSLRVYHITEIYLLPYSKG